MKLLNNKYLKQKLFFFEVSKLKWERKKYNVLPK